MNALKRYLMDINPRLYGSILIICLVGAFAGNVIALCCVGTTTLTGMAYSVIVVLFVAAISAEVIGILVGFLGLLVNVAAGRGDAFVGFAVFTFAVSGACSVVIGVLLHSGSCSGVGIAAAFVAAACAFIAGVLGKGA
jgi:hypothetical protein